MSSAARTAKTWVLAQFDSPEALLGAARAAREKGYPALDAYTPYPLNGLEDALGLRRSKVPLIALVGGLLGIATAYGFQLYTNGFDFPLNVANRPPHSLPAFIPITFELAVLFSSLFIFFGLMALSRLPQPYHPVFEVEAFRSASTHAFWLSVETDAAQAGGVEEQLRASGASEISQVQEEEER